MADGQEKNSEFDMSAFPFVDERDLLSGPEEVQNYSPQEQLPVLDETEVSRALKPIEVTPVQRDTLPSFEELVPEPEPATPKPDAERLLRTLSPSRSMVLGRKELVPSAVPEPTTYTGRLAADLERQAQELGARQGKIGFGEALGQAFSGGEKYERIPFSPTGAIDAITMLKSARRLEAGRGTADDERLIQAFSQQQKIEKERGYTIGGRIAQVLAELPAFAVEFFATMGVASAARKGIGKLLGAGAKEAAKKSLAKRIGIGAAELTAAGAARSLFMPHRVAENVATRRLFLGDEEAPLTSFLRGWGDTVIENLSEESGPVLSKVFGKIPVVAKLAEMASKAKPKWVQNKTLRAMMTKAGFNGVLAEMGEERVGDVLRTLTGIQEMPNLADPQTYKDFMRQLVVEAGAFAVPGTIGLGADILESIPDRMLNRLTGTGEEAAKAAREVEFVRKEVLAERNLDPEMKLDDPQMPDDVRAEIKQRIEEQEAAKAPVEEQPLLSGYEKRLSEDDAYYDVRQSVMYASGLEETLAEFENFKQLPEVVGSRKTEFAKDLAEVEDNFIRFFDSGDLRSAVRAASEITSMPDMTMALADALIEDQYLPQSIEANASTLFEFNARGTYQRASHHVTVNPYLSRQQLARTVLHEALHAVTANRFDAAPQNVKMQVQTLLQSVRQRVSEDVGSVDYSGRWFGLTNEYEFMSEAMTNPQFQDFLKSKRSAFGPERARKDTLWQKFVDIVYSLLDFGGRSAAERTLMHEAIDAVASVAELSGVSRTSSKQPSNMSRDEAAQAAGWERPHGTTKNTRNAAEKVQKAQQPPVNEAATVPDAAPQNLTSEATNFQEEEEQADVPPEPGTLEKQADEKLKKWQENEKKALRGEGLFGRWDRFLSRFIGHDIPLTKILKRTAIGRMAVMGKALLLGAPQSASMQLEDVQRAVNEKLPTKHLGSLNVYRALQNIIEIEKTRTSNKPGELDLTEEERISGVKHPSGFTQEEAEAKLAGMQRKLGPEVWGQIKAADAIIQAKYDEILTKLQNAGMLRADEVERLRAVKKHYNPRLFVEHLERSMYGVPKGQKIDSRDAGLKALEEGSEGALLLDSWTLLGQTLLRTEARIKANEANVSFYKWMQANPEEAARLGMREQKPIGFDDNGKPKYPPTPNGMQRIGFFEPAARDEAGNVTEAEQKFMLVPAEVAQYWGKIPPALNRDLANDIRLFSGSAIVRPLATGYNPEFALGNVARDIAYAIFRTQEYHPVIPIAWAQMARDIIKVAPDVLRRHYGGRVRAAVAQGIGMDNLSSQGKPLADDPMSLHEQGKGVLKGFLSALNAIGQRSEMLTRMAVRERSIQNQLQALGKKNLSELSAEQRKEVETKATYVARNMLDFNQGGSWSKAIDNAVPYFNAAIQGTRGMVQGFREAPVVTSMKAAQVVGFAMMLALMNRRRDEETWEDISDREKTSKWVFPLGKRWTDSDGKSKAWYLAIPKDQGQRVFATIGEEMAEMLTTGKMNFDRIKSSIFDNLPVDAHTFLPPTVSAFLAYTLNKDTWSGEDVWSGRKDLPPEMEYWNSTPEAAVLFGKATGMSPERTRTAMSKVFPKHPITYALGLMTDQMLDMDENMQKSFYEKLSDIPIVRRFSRTTRPPAINDQDKRDLVRYGISITNPDGTPVATRTLKSLVKEARIEAGGPKQSNDNELTRLVVKSRVAPVEARDEYRAWIRSLPESEQDRIESRLKTRYRSDSTTLRTGRAISPDRRAAIDEREKRKLERDILRSQRELQREAARAQRRQQQ